APRWGRRCSSSSRKPCPRTRCIGNWGWGWRCLRSCCTRDKVWRGCSFSLPPGGGGPVADALLRVEGLLKRFGGVIATDRVDLSVAPGEIHALIGPNGAGKTTLIHQLSGALRTDGGRIVFDGRDLTRVSLHQRVHLGLARSYQI